MLTIIADTGAVISLALSGLFDVCKNHFRIIIGERIAEELKEISSAGNDELSKAAREVLKEIEISQQAGILRRANTKLWNC